MPTEPDTKATTPVAAPPLPPKPADLRAPALPQLPPRHEGHRRSRSASSATNAPFLNLAPPPLPPRPKTAKEESRRPAEIEGEDSNELFTALKLGEFAEGSAGIGVKQKQEPPPLPPRPHHGPDFLVSDNLPKPGSAPPKLPPRPHLLPGNVSDDRKPELVVNGTLQNGLDQPERHGTPGLQSLEGQKRQQSVANAAKTTSEKKERFPVPFPRPPITFRLASRFNRQSRKILESPDGDVLYRVEELVKTKGGAKTDIAKSAFESSVRNILHDQSESTGLQESAELIQENLVHSSENVDEGEGDMPVASGRIRSARAIVQLIHEKLSAGAIEDAELLLSTSMRKLLEQENEEIRCFAFVLLCSVFKEIPRKHVRKGKRIEAERSILEVLSVEVEELQRSGEQARPVWQSAIQCATSVLRAEEHSRDTLSVLALYALGKNLDPLIPAKTEELLLATSFCRATGMNPYTIYHLIRRDIDEEATYGTIQGLHGLIKLFQHARSLKSREALMHLTLEVVVSRLFRRSKSLIERQDASEQVRWIGSIFSAYQFHEAFFAQLKYPSPEFALDCVRFMFMEPLFEPNKDSDTKNTTIRNAVTAANALLDKSLILNVLCELEDICDNFLAEGPQNENAAYDSRFTHCFRRLEYVMYGYKHRKDMNSGNCKNELHDAVQETVDAAEDDDNSVGAAYLIVELILSFLLWPINKRVTTSASEALGFLQDRRQVFKNMLFLLDSLTCARLLKLLSQANEDSVSETRQTLVEVLGCLDECALSLYAFLDETDREVARRAQRILKHRGIDVENEISK